MQFDSYEALSRRLDEVHCMYVEGSELKQLSGVDRLDENTWKRVKRDLDSAEIGTVRPKELNQESLIFVYTSRADSALTEARSLLARFEESELKLGDVDSIRKVAEALRKPEKQN